MSSDGVTQTPAGMQAVQVSAIEDALKASWRGERGKDGAPVTHSCALTLVISVEDENAGSDVALVAQQLASKTPLRAIVLRTSDRSTENAVSAWVAHGCEGADGEAICSEQIVLDANAHDPELLVSAVRGLLVPDLPVYLWWRSGSPFGNSVFSELRNLADRIVVDSICFGDGAAALDTLRRLVQRTARPTVRDLNWQRTEPWRNALAACFDDDEILALLPNFNRCAVTFASAGDSRASARSLLLYGWLASRFPPLRGHGKIVAGKKWADVEPGRVVSVALTSSSSGSALTLVRQQAPTAIVAQACDRQGGAIKSWIFPAATLTEAQLLDRCIDSLGRDPLFESALSVD